MLLKDLKELAEPIYQVKPYVLLSKDNIVLSAGTLNEIISLLVEFGDYYEDCIVQKRRYDLFMNDNTKVQE